MSNKDKEISKSKLKNFFKNAKTQGGTTTERALPSEIESDLRPEIPAAQRCRTLRDLGEQLYNINLEEYRITMFYHKTQDLIVPNKPAEHRQTALTFYKKLIQSQYKNLTQMREQFFLVIQNHEVPEDLGHRLELLDTLTENGKDITYFEEKIGKFMLSWIPAIAAADLLAPYLGILENIIKFNAAHLETDTVVGIVQNACHFSCIVEDDTLGLKCLEILEVVIGYTLFPSDPLALCVETLCRTVNNRFYCSKAWKIMKNLLGTQHGYHSMQIMCNILNDSSLYEDAQLLRGAVFHLNMSVFGSNMIFQVSSMFYASTVLTSFLHALDSRGVIVTFEVIISARIVINKYKTELSEIIWDRICDIMSAIVDNLEHYERINIDQDHLLHLQQNFHETIDCIEKLLQDTERTEILGNIERIYDLIERVCEKRSEESVLQLIEYRSSKVTATRPEWLKALNEFIGRFYRMPNTNIRVKTIKCLMNIMDLNRTCYEEEILERVVLPYFGQIVHEQDLKIRVAVARALVDFARHCDTRRCGELLDILEKLINRPFEMYNQQYHQQQHQPHQQQHQQPLQYDTSNTIDDLSTNVSSFMAAGAGGALVSTNAASGFIIKSEADIEDVLTAVDGLIEVFVIKLYRLPSCHAIKIFNILIGHLEQHYERPKVFQNAIIVREKIFTWMLKARANAAFHIGYPDPTNKDVIKFSYYLGIDPTIQTTSTSSHHQNQIRHSTLPAAQITVASTSTNVSGISSDVVASTNTSSSVASSLSTHFTKISIRRAYKILVKCLENEREYHIFRLVIRELPKVLQNKALIQALTQGEDIKYLVEALLCICSEYNNKSLNLTYKLPTNEFYALILPAVAALVTYHQFMKQQQQQTKVISTLTVGVFTSSIVCINAMTTIALEMPDALKNELHKILLQLSKMSDTTMIAIPVLEFLSLLSRLSNHLFANFVVRQYMYVFAISLSYTKPYKYDHYTVSLAHHVIASWFLKCRLECRRNLVTYITSSIQTNTYMLKDDIKNFTRTVQPQDFNSLNEDSSNRKRSTSLTERGSRNTQTTRSGSEMRPMMDEKLKTFHTELAETCIDFLARHTYSPCPALPKRLPSVEYLLKDGLSQTWLVGHSLVTITTAGCTSGPTRNGLCERCAQLGKAANLIEAKANSDSSSIITAPLSPEIITTGNQQQQQQQLQQQTTGERRYTKISLQHSSGNESAGSTDLTSSSSSSAAHGTQRQTSNSSTASLEALSRRGSNPEVANSGGGEIGGVNVGTSGSSTSLLGNSISTTSVSAISPTQQLQPPSTMQATPPPPPPFQQQTCIRSCTGWAEVYIRRPTGNISWITRIQNPISNDCFGQDLPLSKMVSLFLPTTHGGVFGPDLMPTNEEEETEFEAGVGIGVGGGGGGGGGGGYDETNASRESLTTAAAAPVATAVNAAAAAAADKRRRTGAVAKARALQRQEEICSTTTASSGGSTAAIDIPKTTMTTAGKRGKETGSVSDGEADEDTLAAFHDDPTLSRARNPVRRVNSSPEMSSSWRHTFLANKPPPLSREFALKSDSQPTINESGTESTLMMTPASVTVSASAYATMPSSGCQTQKNKKSVQYTKDMRVSCEAIPEEIAGSTPPQNQNENVAITKTASADADASISSGGGGVGTLPPKQHSADDVTVSQQQQHQQQQSSSQLTPVQLSDSSTSLKYAAGTKMGPVAAVNKPPLSPAPQQQQPPQSPRLDKHAPIMFSTPQKLHQGLAKSSSSSGAGGNGSGGVSAATLGVDFNNGGGSDIMRGRSKTISVVREVNGKTRPPAPSSLRSFSEGIKSQGNAKLCMNPSFVFLQLYETGQLGVTDTPIKLPPDQMSAVSLLDLALPFETHRIGVLYVGAGQCNSIVEILRNSYGSTRYLEFLHNIGTLVSLKESEQKNLFFDLDTSGADGKFTYVWKDDIVQVTFHVATLMPTNLKKDPNCNEKKKHIGNDFVHIVYNESGEEYKLNTVSGQFSYACVVVEPLELNTNRVKVIARPEIEKYVCHPEPKIVSDKSAPLLARQFALHANLASLVFRSVHEQNLYASNWLERLRKIKRLRKKLLENQQTQQQSGTSTANLNTAAEIDDRHTNRDFTKYT